MTVVKPPKNPTCCADISFQKNTSTKISAKNSNSRANAKPTWARTHKVSRVQQSFIIEKASTLQLHRST